MEITRRGLLGILAAGASAAIIRTPGLLMPIKPVRTSGVMSLADFAREHPEWASRIVEKMASPPLDLLKITRVRFDPEMLGRHFLSERRMTPAEVAQEFGQ